MDIPFVIEWEQTAFEETWHLRWEQTQDEPADYGVLTIAKVGGPRVWLSASVTSANAERAGEFLLPAIAATIDAMQQERFWCGFARTTFNLDVDGSEGAPRSSSGNPL